jgi:catechol 2,3-dioxygenase-like lactoylglutathione lyase family enzyme
MDLELTHVVLPCDVPDRMKRFYHDLLGLPIERDNPGWLELKAGAAILGLKTGSEWNWTSENGSAATHVCFRAPNREAVTAAHDSLAKQGIRIVAPPQDWKWGDHACFISDPEDNLVEIFVPL